ncbi:MULTISPECIES: hypothetical protein [Kocuria]|uniref:hypothetical protein n=1 Tax=Kocuria TaxID=57493 RepID=UPI0006D78C10|nr:MULTISPECIES: hypothetical protein [Kocuria]MDA4829694.1 hypothetical protein [Kocuria rhizophila]
MNQDNVSREDMLFHGKAAVMFTERVDALNETILEQCEVMQAHLDQFMGEVRSLERAQRTDEAAAAFELGRIESEAMGEQITNLSRMRDDYARTAEQERDTFQRMCAALKK